MAWCPVCKNEYRAGIKVCADCGAELVESLQENPMVPLIAGDEAALNEAKDFLVSSKTAAADVRFLQDRGVYCLFVPKNDLQKAAAAVQVFMNDRAAKAQRQFEEDVASGKISKEQAEEIQRAVEAQRQPVSKKGVMYESSAKKAEENRASAWSLFGVGVIGLVLIVLCLTGVIQLPGIFSGSYMFFGVMGALCILFIVLGFVSFKNAKVFEKDVESENTLKESLETWCKENLRGAEIDRYIRMHDPTVSSETIFFPRMEMIKARINKQFMNLDQAFLDQFVDEVVYEMVFPEEVQE